MISEMESIPGEDAMQIVEMIKKKKKRLRMSLVDKAAIGLERTISNFERSSAIGKNAIKQPCILKRNHLWKEDQQINVANFTILL